MEKDTEFLLCTERKSLSFLQYELIFSFKNGRQYLKSFNIVMNDVILHKFYLERPFEVKDETEIAQVITNKLIPVSETKSKQPRKNIKRPANADARETVSMELLNRFQL